MAKDISSVKKLASAGAITALSNIADASSGNASAQQVSQQQVAGKSLDKITDITVESPDEAGSELVLQVIEANATNDIVLESCVEKVVNSTAGESALKKVIQSAKTHKTARVAAARALGSKKRQGKHVTVKVADREEVKSVLNAAEAHVGTPSMADSSALLSCIEMTAETAEIMVEEGVVEMLSTMISTGAADTNALQALKNVILAPRPPAPPPASSATEEAKAVASTAGKPQSKPKPKPPGSESSVESKLRELKIAATLAAALKESNDTGFSNDCISLLQSLAATSSADELGLDESALHMIAESNAEKGGVDSLMHSLASTSSAAASMVNVGVVSDEQVEQHLEETMTMLESQPAVEELKTDDGKIYYVNTQTQETTWEKPAELQTIERQIDRLVDMCEVRGAEIKDLQTQLPNVLKVIESNSGNAQVTRKLVQCVNQLALNSNNCAQLAKSGGINTILRALHKHAAGTDADVIAQCLKLISRFAVNDGFKQAIAEANGLELVLHCVHARVQEKKIAHYGVSALGNMAFNYMPGVQRMVKGGCIKVLEKVLQTWTSEAKVIEVTLVTMSNIMYQNDAVKRDLGLTCGDEVVESVMLLREHTPVCIAAMRALGNLASLEENISWMLENGAVTNIVAAIGSNKDNTELVQTAVDVMGNLASIEDENVDQATLQSLQERIFAQGGPEEIFRIIEGNSDSGVLMSCLDTLSALAVDETLCTERLQPLGVSQHIVRILQEYDWDAGIAERAMVLVSSLTYFDDYVDELAELGVVALVVSALDEHDDTKELVVNSLSALTNLCINVEEQDEVMIGDGIDTIFGILLKYIDDTEVISEVLNVLIRIACTDEHAVTIGEKGMSEILGTYKRHIDDTQYITVLFQLVAQLAFQSENLDFIIQYHGIDHVIDAVARYPDNADLVLKAVQIIDNCGTSSTEAAQIVLRQGGGEMLETIISSLKGHPGFEAVVNTAESAKLGLQAIGRMTSSAVLSSKEAATHTRDMLNHLGAGKQEIVNEDPLQVHKTRLTTGMIMEVWNGGGTRFVYVTPDMSAVAWRKRDSKRAKDIKSTPLSSIHKVTRGLRPGGHKKGARSALRERAFYLTGGVGRKQFHIDLEAPAEGDMLRWVESLNAILFPGNQSA